MRSPTKRRSPMARKWRSGSRSHFRGPATGAPPSVESTDAVVTGDAGEETVVTASRYSARAVALSAPARLNLVIGVAELAAPRGDVLVSDLVDRDVEGSPPEHRDDPAASDLVRRGLPGQAQLAHCQEIAGRSGLAVAARDHSPPIGAVEDLDRKSTRLNSSHLGISYAV